MRLERFLRAWVMAGAALGCGRDATRLEGGSTIEVRSPAPRTCVDFSHFDRTAGDPSRGTWDLHLTGTQFDADEGALVRVVVTMGEPSYALAATVIHSGSFEVVLPGIIQPYTGVGLYIDRDGNEACTSGTDSVWQRTSGGVFTDFNWQATPDTRLWQPHSPCSLNGIFDLATRLPCP